MKPLVRLLAAALVPALPLAAAVKPAAMPAPKVMSTRHLNANAWDIVTSNYGPFCWPDGVSGGYWGGPGYNYIYGGGLWFAGTTPSAVRAVAVGYNPTSGQSEMGPVNPFTGSWAAWLSDPQARVYLSTDPADVLEWPLLDSLGDPAIKSFQDSYAKFSDENPMYTFSGESRINVAIEQTSHAWSFYSLNDIVFLRFRVKNLNAYALTNCYLGPCADCDIGSESGTNANDRCLFDYYRNLGYQFQTDPEPGWPKTGVVGFRFFESPRNNTGATVNIVDDQFPHSIPPDSILGLTAFTIFSIAIDPQTDEDRYLAMEGVDWQTMILDAYDQWGALTPDDKRFIMASGPFILGPDSVATTCVGILAAEDTVKLKVLSDYAQLIYNSGFTSTQISVTSPNGREVVSGTASVTWANPAPSCTASVYCSSDDGATWSLLEDSIPDLGSYSWNTTLLPDGTRYRIGIYIQGGLSFGWDASDTCFTVNNAVDATPEILLLRPQAGLSLDSQDIISFWFDQADGAACFFVPELSGQDTSLWSPLGSFVRTSQLWARDSVPWDTRDWPNYDRYRLRLTVTDGDDTVSTTTGAFAIDNPYQSVDSLTHASGCCNTVLVNPYVWDQGQLTGHLYEFRFKNILRGSYNYNYYLYEPKYVYDLWDTDLNAVVLADRGCSVPMDDTWYWDVPSPVDGFVPEVRYNVDGYNMRTDSLKVTAEAGPVSLDTLLVHPLDTNLIYSANKWMFRGCRYEVRWHVCGSYPNDTLTAEVWDMDNGVTVPQDTTSVPGASCWTFGTGPSSTGRSLLTNAITTMSRKAMFICGTRLFFNRGSVIRNMTWDTHPSEGEVWSLYTSGPKPPRLGDVFSFRGSTGVSNGPGALTSSLFLAQNLPNPFRQLTTIRYQITKPGLVSLKVYNVAGQLVRTVVSTSMPAGHHSVSWDGRDEMGRKAAAGVYLYQLKAGDRALTRKMVLIR